ncbi:hypothetical protein G4Z05_00525 [Bacillus thermocopriae]|uniref:Uncharacterized protein n=1 Tax=Neobacillus thermocopriae TaxID=1215031 RepID=A0A6B3TKC7_9BACI|nr:hypothetical protein [Neobacillus thermocopriae]NEX77385.1 hypothetical protein [Neobacillus thermocopriae]
MNTLQQGLKKWTKKNNFYIMDDQKLIKRKPKNKKNENLSKRDLEDLMGTRMRTWKRGRGGALRQ